MLSYMTLSVVAHFLLILFPLCVLFYSTSRRHQSTTSQREMLTVQCAQSGLLFKKKCLVTPEWFLGKNTQETLFYLPNHNPALPYTADAGRDFVNTTDKKHLTKIFKGVFGRMNEAMIHFSSLPTVALSREPDLLGKV